MEPLALLGGRLTWLPTALRPAEDAFWLAASVPALAPETPVLDAGCGNGAAGLALLCRQPTLRLHGLDLNPQCIAEAKAHAALNHSAATFQCADLLTLPTQATYGQILCNPPFHERARGHATANSRKALAHGLDDLTPWVTACAQLLQPGGGVSWVLHAALQPALSTAAIAWGGELHLAPLATHPTRAPKRLLAFWKPSKNKVFQIIHHNLVPAYHTPLREAVLRDGQSLAAAGYGW